jgi:hypothetical protein
LLETMNFTRNLPWNWTFGCLLVGLGIAGITPRAAANIYATNVRINNGTTNVIASATNTISISYILNEPSSLTTIQILSGTTVVTNLQLEGQNLGSLRGPNEIFWNGLETNLPSGAYSVRILAASSGYTNWTQITSDTDDINTYVFEGHGIAVDQNQSSPYYGRVFVANSFPGFGSAPGDSVGILKFNADTSDAEEGSSSAGSDGHNWLGDHVSPWKLEVSADDWVYVDDLANGGEIYRWDPTISSNSMQYVLRQDNQPKRAALSGPAITGLGANTQIWMANTNAAQIYRWSVNGNGVCATNETGTLIATNATTNFFDVALDASENLFTCTFTTLTNDPSPRVFRYPSVTAVSSSLPETSPVWAVGNGDDTYAGASAVALDPSDTYLAVAFEGPGTTFSTNGNTKILWATNGTLVTNLDLGVAIQGDATHDDTDCAWDAVGNVYYIDNYLSRWKAVSPPGSNYSTTVALGTIVIGGGGNPPPTGPVKITKIAVNGGLVSIDFSAGSNDVAAAFSILGAAVVTGPYTAVTSATITRVGPGLFHATFALGPSTQYFRIEGQGGGSTSSAPAFSKISSSGSNLVLTFSGSSSDSTSSFTLMSSATATGSYATVNNATVTQLSPGVFQVTVPGNGPTQFYKIRR